MNASAPLEPTNSLPVTGLHRVTAYLHVADVEASARFYGGLGLRVSQDYRDASGAMVWAWLEAERAPAAGLILAKASGPIDAHQQAAMLYMHATDVTAIRDRLLAAGAAEGRYIAGAPVGPAAGAGRCEGGVVFPIQRPAYMPAGELRVHDPDGYVILVGQEA